MCRHKMCSFGLVCMFHKIWDITNLLRKIYLKHSSEGQLKSKVSRVFDLLSTKSILTDLIFLRNGVF